MSSPERKQDASLQTSNALESNDEHQEYTLEPADLTDFTIHFQSASYHVHRLTLFTESKYFRVLLSPDAQTGAREACTLTTRCREPNHRCMSIPGSQIGGTTVTVEELRHFLEHLTYGVNKTNLVQWRRLLKEGDLVDYQDVAGEWHLMKIMHIDQNLATLHIQNAAGSSFNLVTSYSSSIQPAYSMTSADKTQWRQGLQPGDLLSDPDPDGDWYTGLVLKKEDTRVFVTWIGFADEHDDEWIVLTSGAIRIRTSPWMQFQILQDNLQLSIGLHLSHYLDCAKMLQHYHDMAVQYMKELLPRQTTCMFQLLALGDRYHWERVISGCIDLIASSPRAWSDEWQTHYNSLSRNTLAQLCQAALARS